MRSLEFILAALLMTAVSAAPQGTPPREVKSNTLPSGASLYRSYCASCHGQDARGGGPVADALRMRPADLTVLKQRNNAEFPAFRLKKMLDGSDDLPAHGSRRMPVWGPGLGPERTKTLIQYLESIQK